MKTYVYKPHVLQSLGYHGVVPKPTTAPAQLREFLNDLYRYELRQLRDRYMRREFSKADYQARVSAVRSRYPLMSLPVEFWME